MIELVISGGQTGADQGAIRAARACGIRTGGWACKGWLVEGPNGRGWMSAPWLADWGLKECQEDGFPARTRLNVRDSEVTIWFGPTGSDGYFCTKRAAEEFGRPFWIVNDPANPTTTMGHRDLAMFLMRDRVRVIDCCGSRESKCPAQDGKPGIGERVERFLVRVFRTMEGSGGLPAMAGRPGGRATAAR